MDKTFSLRELFGNADKSAPRGEVPPAPAGLPCPTARTMAGFSAPSEDPIPGSNE